MKILRQLYKNDSSGKTRFWRVEVEDNKYRTVHGILDGTEVTTAWTECEPKNVGRSNETTGVEQAELEAEALIVNKMNQGKYVSELKNVNDKEKFISPMLAKEYTGTPPFIGSAYSQPKLDGIRCVLTSKGMFTRQGKPIHSCPHIIDATVEVFKKNPDYVLDGELYNHKANEDFNTITSIVRRTKLTEDDLRAAESFIQYHVYDLVGEGSFEKRHAVLRDLVVSCTDMKYVKLVQTTKCIMEEDLDRCYQGYMSNGYEGQMVRNGDSDYEHKRSKNLLKRKEFKTDEFEVVSVDTGEGTWARAIKTFNCVTHNGIPFSAGVRGEKQQLEDMYASGKLPKWATIRFFEYTPAGSLRFPIVIDYGYSKRED